MIMNKLFDDNFLDTLSVVSFIIGVMNYQENLTQSDKADLVQQFNQKIEELLQRLEKDIDEQNEMLEEILSILRSHNEQRNNNERYS